MTICSLASEAISGLSQGSGSSVVSSLANVLGVLGAADIGIQLGSGGQAGLFDLPNLLNTPGIECADPDTGEVTYVTPAQWYGNGMSCSGLKNPDQERIKEEIRRFDERLKNFENLKKREPSLPSELFYADPKSIKKLDNLLKENPELISGGKSGTSFDRAGILTQKFGASSYTNSQGTDYYRPSLDKTYVIFTGTQLLSRSSGFTFKDAAGGTAPTYPASADDLYNGPAFAGGTSSYWLSSRMIGQPLSIVLPCLKGTDFLNINVRPQSFIFTPAASPPPGAYIVTTIDTRKKRDPRDPCDGGEKQPMPCSQCKLTPDLIKKINDLHKATGADKLSSGMPYFPEKDIRAYGKQLYQGNPNNVNGQVKPGNLIDVIAATIAAEYHRLGLQRLPAELPKSLAPKDKAEELLNQTMKVDNTLSFQEQIFKLQDEVLGQWPINYEITDDGKKKDVKLYNLAEAIAELYGMQVKVVEDSDLAVHWGIRAAIEASKGNNSALKTLHLLQEFVKFTGCITAPGSLTVNCTFTPDPVAQQTNEQMLKPSAQTIIVTNIVDGSSILELLKTISYASQIAAKAVLQPIKTNPATGQPQMPGDFIKAERKKRKVDDKSFEKWKQEKEKPIANVPTEQYPPGYKVPSINEIKSQPDEKK